MNVLAIVPARGGSKGIHRKNLRLLGGKPLLQYPIDSAFESTLIDKVVVSTDDEEIAQVGESFGAEVVMRPDELSGDTSLVIDAIIYTLNWLKTHQSYEPAVVVLLEPTSPFRSAENIDKAINLIKDDRADSVATITDSPISPGRLWKIEEGELAYFLNTSDPFQPRQKQPKAYVLTGQIYAFRPSFLKQYEDASVLMGRVHPIITDSLTAIDIDEEIDLAFAEQILNHVVNT